MKSKLKIIIPVGIALIAIALAFVFIRFAPTKTTDIGTMISTAQQYLTEQKYEQAIAEFRKIIEIDPKNADAYIGMAKAYIGIGDTDKAIEVLEDGYEQTNDDRILEMLEELKSGEESTTETVAETTTKVMETEITETTEEVTDTETTENAKIEQIRQQALDILSPYACKKPKGIPNSTDYKYYSEYEEEGQIYRYYCMKSEYDGEGDLIKYYFTILVNESDYDVNPKDMRSFGNIETYKPVYSDMSFCNNILGLWVTEREIWYPGVDNWYCSLFSDQCIIKSDNEYEIGDVIITVDGDTIKKIESYNVGSLVYDDDSSTWKTDDFIKPYIIGLPEGCDDSIFEIDERKVAHKFKGYDDYLNYVNNN